MDKYKTTEVMLLWLLIVVIVFVIIKDLLQKTLAIVQKTLLFGKIIIGITLIPFVLLISKRSIKKDFMNNS